jgi:nucleotide-binding universal stress UspA family protein
MALQGGKVLRELFPAWTVSAEAYSGSPAGEIIEKAEEWQPDLIVVGSHGRSGLGRLILGSVSQRVVTEALCSVRVARYQGGEKEAPVRIVIGVDGSAGAELAVDAVAARTWPNGSEARLVSSISPLREISAEDKTAFMKFSLQAAEEKLRSAGLRVESLVKDEDPKQLLVNEAEQWKADSIFVGARGLGRVKRFLLGSVSTAVVSRAHCSVEVARRG